MKKRTFALGLLVPLLFAVVAIFSANDLNMSERFMALSGLSFLYVMFVGIIYS